MPTQTYVKISDSEGPLKVSRRTSEGPAPISSQQNRPRFSAVFLNSIKKADPPPKTKRYFDSNGLFIEVRPNGGMYWRMKYFYPARREQRISFGVYPEVSLKEARERRDECRAQLRRGIDPKAAINAARASAEVDGNTFEAIAREWHQKLSLIHI